jgi:sigma-B regulation protein RsbU (phosphoserine phosphatase)
MKLFFEREAPKRDLRIPRPSVLPCDADLTVSALYKGSRVGGDFYEFVPLSDTRMLFLLTDIAGRRDEALNIAAAVQDALRTRGPELLSDPEGNVSEGVAALTIELNRIVMSAAGGVRPAPAFLGCLDEQFGLMHYVSAGHTPAFVKDLDGLVQLDPSGLPLGLFSHSTHDAQVSVVHPGASIVMVSKGLVEIAAGKQEFGTDRVREILESRTFRSAHDLCHEVLERAVNFSEQPSVFGPQFRIPGFKSANEPNDLTVVCVMRMVHQMAARA